MRKSEAEPLIRSLAHKWATEVGFDPNPQSVHNSPSYLTFRAWLVENRYGHLLQFRSTMGPDYFAELWFDQELRQTWRN